ncbi:MAG: alpha-L-fucosidase [Planctomycetota bacterium]
MNITPTPLPRIAHFESLGYGLFLHWGLYSQLGQGEWIQKHNEIPLDDYRRLQQTFTAQDFDADAWCRLALDAGMKYLCLTTRHHEGFSLYDTRGLNTYDAPHSPAQRDLVAEFIDACDRHGLLPMLYHTTLDWQWRNKKTYDLDQAEMDDYLDYLNDSVEILCSQYGKIGGLWFDGNWSRRDLDWKVDALYAVIRKHQPEAIIVNNTGLKNRGVVGHPEIDSVTYEQGAPEPRDQRSKQKYVAGEMCLTLNQHWGVGFHDLHYKSPADVIRMLAKCRRAGANLLLNVGPTAQGGIPEYEAACLRRAGDWVRSVGEPLHIGRPVPEVKCPGDDFLLRTPDGSDHYFAFGLAREGDSHVTLDGGGVGPRSLLAYDRPVGRIAWLDADDPPLDFTQNLDAGLLTFHATGYPYGTDRVVRVARIASTP